VYTILNSLQRVFNERNEQRVLKMLRGSEMPSWVRSASWADPELHAMGVDIVVKTDRKSVFLQVKPNYVVAHALKRFAQFPLAIIVCNDTTVDEHLRMRLLEGLEYGYNRT
jgi:hypothetical protein